MNKVQERSRNKNLKEIWKIYGIDVHKNIAFFIKRRNNRDFPLNLLNLFEITQIDLKITIQEKFTITSIPHRMVEMNKKTFIFLDIDGVLNLSSQWGRMYRLHDGCVRNFAEYIQSIGIQNCRIILSSSWKNGWNGSGCHSKPIFDLLQKLKPYGIKFFGKTGFNAEGDRAKEINEFILSHKLQDVPCIVIDDDLSVFHSKLLPNCKMLHVDSSKGFQYHQKRKKWYEL